MIKDMTIGKPSKILIAFAIPMMLGNIFQQAYSIIDSIIVGNFVGSSALASVGATYPITFVLITIANGASIGCAVIISQYFGSQNISKMKTAIYTSLISITVLGLILTLIGIILNKAFLNLLATPRDIFDDSYDYLHIYFLGIIFLFVYNICNSVFNALGNAKLPLYFLIFSSILNVFLDLLFVIKFNLSVKGVAYATFLSQGIACIFSFIYLLKELKVFKNVEKSNFFDFRTLKSISKVALPSMLQQSIVSFGNLLLQSLVNSYGTVVIAGFSIATKIDSIIILPMVSLSNAISTFAGQNIGAKKINRVREGYKTSIIIILIFCIITSSIIFLFGNNITSLFSRNEDIINISIQYLKIVSSFYFFMGLMVITNGVLRANKDMKFFLLSTTINFSTRVIFAYILSFIVTQKFIWFSIPLGWLFASTTSILRYKSDKWLK
ncbi:MATE family efflux transporter [uncultured Clostridium sp.]|uniref:MATE family efflux transporter n=1 Tax=uncultured Clostridium sp. TaxID=59620 RepID=UPI0025EB6728|nr:MATE family efflux transporter [uncultured Clostridium sp.]